MDEAHRQTALALAALAVAFAETLKELLPDEEEALTTLQRKSHVVQTKLRQTPGGDAAAEMFRFVIDALQNPDIVDQPSD
jgi:hypothetical protein